MAVFGIGLAGCSDTGQDDSRDLNIVTVNWIEGLALTYMQEQILEDSLDMNVDVREAQGGGVAFSSVAEGDRDFFNEAWLPTTHKASWNELNDKLQKLGYTYRGTSGGLVVPAYMDIEHVDELGRFRDALDGTINGIESGATVNDQARQVLENNGVDGFKVVASSGPAAWQALENAVDNEEPIVVTGWHPHWKWGSYDLKYLQGARTEQSPVFGDSEDIFTLVDNEFIDEFPREAVCFLQTFEAEDEALNSLMVAFNERGDTSKEEAAAQWIDNNPTYVNQWMEQTRECASSDEPIEPLPDDA